MGLLLGQLVEAGGLGLNVLEQQLLWIGYLVFAQ